MTSAQFRRWRKRSGLSLRGAAELLDVNSVTIWRYEAGRLDIPKTVALAVEHLSEGRSERSTRR